MSFKASSVRSIQNMGQTDLAANGLVGTFNIPHSLGKAPAIVLVCPRNNLSAALYSITSDSTNIIINYIGVPLAGTLSYYWMVA